MATDILVDTPNPEALDVTIQQLGGALLESSPGVYLQHQGHYVVRALGDPGFLEFSMTTQGYATVVGMLDSPL